LHPTDRPPAADACWLHSSSINTTTAYVFFARR
jgi:hypothetical protein